MNQGFFCISLDFELMWGRKERATIDSYGKNVAGVREALPRLLDLFAEYGIHATWAIVGLLLAESKAEMLTYAPDPKPRYENDSLSAYRYLDEVGEDEARDVYHFGLSLARRILTCPDQEIGTHTYSHYYCTEKGQSKETFQADLDASRKITRDKLGREVQSIIFPRNQLNPAYEPVLTDAGILAYRGRERSRIYNEPDRQFKRIVRLADAYVNLTGPKCYCLEDTVKRGMVDLSSSRLYRPFMPNLAFLEGLKVRRIRQQMRAAARKGQVFHLWWHPHNIGVRTDIHLAQLRIILDYYRELSERYGFASRNMGELAAMALEGLKSQ